MKKIFLKSLSFISAFAFPIFAFAQNQFNSAYFTNFLDQIKKILQSIVPVLITLAIVFFFWELVMFIKARSKGEAKEVKSAREGIIWALVAIFIMLSFLGFVRILQGITGTGNSGNINATDVPVVTF